MIDATRGPGPALVEACLALGAKVLAAGHMRTALDELRAELRHHHRLETAECDVRATSGLGRLIAAFGPTDVLHVLEDRDVARRVVEHAGEASVVLVGEPELAPDGEGFTVTSEPAARVVTALVGMTDGGTAGAGASPYGGAR